MSSPSGVEFPSSDQIAELDPTTRALLAAQLLEGLEPGVQPVPLFTQISRLVTQSTVEVVPIHNRPGTGPQVYLTKRPDDDPGWPGMWHVPGTIILANDTVPHDDEIDFDAEGYDPLASYTGPVRRLLDEELHSGVEIIDGPHLVTSRFRRGIRGSESTTMLSASIEIVDEAGLERAGGRFFAPDNLPHELDNGLIVGHARLVELAMDKYQA